MNLSVGQCATLACLLEATAPKVGNVHRSADFADTTFVDFAASAVAIGPAMQAAADGQRFGATVLAAVKATREVTSANTNLGAVMLLAPLAAATRGGDRQQLAERLGDVLSAATPEDSADVYAAIRLANPGGLGEAEEMDVAGTPPDDLLAAMRAAEGRDLVARQYAADFADVHALADSIAELRGEYSLTDAIVLAHLRLLSRTHDTLIARKGGVKLAEQARRFAATVVETHSLGEESFLRAAADFDFWLRADGNRRNPGATADLVAAALFVLLWTRRIEPPLA